MHNRNSKEDLREDPKKEWGIYCAQELARALPLLSARGFLLEEEQPHTKGERYLSRAVTTESGRKLILLGRRTTDNLRVVIKATSDPAGIRELEHERKCRDMLHELKFAYGTFYSQPEVAHLREGGIYISIHQFIPQKRTFLERPIEEQASLALRAFKAQESAHATTHRHITQIQRVFESYDAKRYLQQFALFEKEIATELPDRHDTLAALARAATQLKRGKNVIEQYCGFLTHTDFVPHNIRITDDTIYLLDFSSLRFGNKYEGWARFLNFMALYNPALEAALVTYVADNRTPEEVEVLRLMRIYRLGEILRYYLHACQRSTGDLKTLNDARITFWTHVLESILDGRTLPEEIRTDYIHLRDTLRSDDEKKRQQGLH